MRKIERELRREFPEVRIEMTSKQHIRLTLPNGKSVFVSSTPSCQHYMAQVRADVRRAMGRFGLP